MRRVSMVLLLVGLLMGGAAPAASAAPPPPEPTPTQCLEAFDRIDGDYVGDGWVRARVAGPPPVDWFTALFDDTDREFSLYCGDELSGVVHIGYEQGTGSGHSISAEDERNFLNCWALTVGSGRAEPDSPGRTRFVNGFGSGRYSVAIVDTDRRFTYTLFTTGDRSNDWLPCIIKRA